MALQLNDRVKESSITTGVVPIVLAGAPTGYQNVASSISTSNTFPYVVELVGGSEWEIGIGQYISANNSIIRTQILNSSNSSNIVNFSAGTKNVFISVPAAYIALAVRGLSQFANTTGAELASIISDTTGTGNLVFANNAVFVTPTIGIANGTSLNLTTAISSNLSLVGPSLSANLTRFPNALAVVSNTAVSLQQNETHNIGLIAEGVANASNTSIYGIGVYGVGYTNAGTRSGGVVGEGHVTSSSDGGSAIGVRGYAHDIHAGGLNVGLYGDATNGSANYALAMNNGDILSNFVQTWYLNGGLTFTGGANTVTIPNLVSSNAYFSSANGTQPFTVVSNTVISNLNADLLDGQHGTYYTGLIGNAHDKANTGVTIATAAFSVANTETIGQAAFGVANTGVSISTSGFNQANTGLSLAQTKVTSFFQNTSPLTANTKDTWIHSDTGVKYENVGNTSSPVWMECGPTGVANSLIPGVVSATSVLSSSGIYSTGTYTGSYSDGIVLDYVNGNGRLSVGANDGLTFYNSGVGANTLLTISSAGQIYSNYTGANSGATLMLSGNNTFGGSGYFDFLRVTNNAPGATNPSKTIRLNITGGLEIIDNAYGNTLFLMDNSGHIITSGYGLLTTNRPAFRVVGNGGAVSATTTMTSTNWTVDFNQGSYLNSSTGIFTAPVQGLYQVNVVVRTNSNSLNAISQIIIQKTAYSGGATSTQIMVEFGNNTSMNHAGGSAIVKMAVGDTLKFIVSAGTISFDGNDNWSVAYIG
jgi:hypothetical protein